MTAAYEKSLPVCRSKSVTLDWKVIIHKIQRYYHPSAWSDRYSQGFLNKTFKIEFVTPKIGGFKCWFPAE